MRSSLLWGYVFGAVVASSAWTYPTIYPTLAQREKLAAAFGTNTASAALFGPAPDLQTIAGFTAFKVSMTLMIAASLWGLLTSTRLLRGEEDAGRWELFLAGQTTRSAATTQALSGLGAAAVVLWAVTALITVAVGATSRVGIHAGPALFLAVALTCPAVMFLAVGALSSQLAPTRRAAAGYGAAVVAAAYGLRMVGDAGIGLHGLDWVSPLGWVEQLRPLTSNDPWPLLPIAAFTALVSAAAVRLAGRRDLGAAVLGDRSESAPKLALLGSALGLSVRLVRATAVAWVAALGVFGLLFGMVARGAGESLSGSSLQATFAKLGATGGGTGAYLAIAFLLVAVLLGFVAAGQVVAARAEEAEGRLDHLLARPLARGRWLAGRAAVAVVLMVVSGLTAALCTWLGTATQGRAAHLGSLLAAGVNAVAPAVVILGLGILLLGAWPRAVGAGTYAVLAWSVLVVVLDTTGGLGASGRWLLDTSVFHHVAAAPATAPDWASDAVLVTCGLLAAAGGLTAFRHRDLTGA